MNNFVVHVSEDAKQMLNAHAAFLDQVSEAAADSLVASFFAAVNSLVAFPMRCPWYSAEYVPRNAYRYLLFEKRYALIFQVEDAMVYVDYVIDCRQDYAWLFQ
ncbi:MAG: type II toxin-antitoxin system RelE/ParE family toxin [Oscillospiraceae bacterium]|nr:type II toxin-antitoxin system RelE/ParE family toxin [Oscillospiraceae bacterium]